MIKTNKDFQLLSEEEAAEYFKSLTEEEVEELTVLQKEAYEKFQESEEEEQVDDEETKKVFTLKDNRLFIENKTIERHEFNDEWYKKLVKVVGGEKEAKKYLIQVTPSQLKKLKEESKSGVVASNKQETGK